MKCRPQVSFQKSEGKAKFLAYFCTLRINVPCHERFLLTLKYTRPVKLLAPNNVLYKGVRAKRVTETQSSTNQRRLVAYITGPKFPTMKKQWRSSDGFLDPRETVLRQRAFRAQ